MYTSIPTVPKVNAPTIIITVFTLFTCAGFSIFLHAPHGPPQSTPVYPGS